MKQRNPYQEAFEALPPHLKQEALKHLAELEKPVLACDFGTSDRTAIIQKLIDHPNESFEAGTLAAPVVERLVSEGIASGIVERFSDGRARRALGVTLSREERQRIGPYENGPCPNCGEPIWFFANCEVTFHCPHCNSNLTIR